MTNYFRMEIDPQTVFYEYHITGIPNNEKHAGKKRYMTTVIESVPFLKNNCNSFATDYVKTIISWVNIHEPAPGVQVQVSNATSGGGAEWRLVDVVDRKITAHLNLHYLRQVDVRGLQEFSATNHSNPAAYDPGPAENALNIIMTRCISTTNTLQLNGHKFYVRNAFFDIRANGTAPLRALRGYDYGVKPAMGGILLNVGLETSAFWRPLLVSEVLAQGSLRPFGDDEMALKGVRVYITYERGPKSKSQLSGVNDKLSRIKIIRGFGKACNVQDFQFVRNVNGQNQATRPTVEQYQR
jgi:eukaryotic translation initiation factor 2C